MKANVNLDALARSARGRVTAKGAIRVVARPRSVRVPRGTVAPTPQTRTQGALASVSPFAAAAAPAVYTGFRGLIQDFNTGVVPPDTNGAVGPHDVVTMLNSQVQIQDRTGAVRNGYPIDLNTFWSPLGSITGAFDPRILYDASQDRWIASSAANGQSTTDPSVLLLGVTETGDPGGTWDMWEITIGNAGGNWGDYPELGFNANWVVVSLNIFSNSGYYRNTAVYVFGKADLYSNGTGNSTIFTDSYGDYTPVLDPGNSSPNTMYFMQEFAADSGYTPANVGTIVISKLAAPLAPSGGGFPTGNAGEIRIGDAWSDSAPTTASGDIPDFAPQLGASARIDTGDSRLQNCVMRGGTIWCAHTVFLPSDNPTRSAVQWFQVDPGTAQVLQRGRIDDPSGSNFYAYPSIAVNSAGDTLIGYNRFSANDYASAQFSFRTAQDPPGTMRQDVTFKRGEAPYVTVGQRSGSNRWGDFSTTVVDPADGLTFWTIQEYAAAASGSQGGMFGTWWAAVTAPSAAPSCSYTLSPGSQTLAAGGGNGSVAVSANTGCAWMAASNASWLHVISGGQGSGSGTVAFAADAYTGPGARSATMSIAGQTFAVTEGSITQQPALPARGIVNAASYQGGAVAPGELVTIFGTGLGPGTLAQPSVNSGAVGTAAGGTSVLFDGVAASMIYAEAGQVSAVVPMAVQGHAGTEVQVLYQGTLSSATTVPVVAVVPGIFTMHASGQGPGAILNQDLTVNSKDNPAAANSVVALYATGFGVIPGAQEGLLATSGQLDPSTVTARIGGVPAKVTYAGVAPGIVVGVVQVNVTVPAGVAAGSAVPVDLTIGGVTSPAGVTLAVK